jgi:hypothetical protein
MPQICDMEQDRLSLSPPKEGRVKDFFRPEKSDGFDRI